MAPHRPTVVILGAGFAGIGVAQELRALMPDAERCSIVLVDQHNFSLFAPMLTEVAGGTVDPYDIVAAVRGLAPGVTFEQGVVTRVDAANRAVTLRVGDSSRQVPEVERTIHADHLVIALGSVTNFHGIHGVEDHSLTIKTVDDAAAIRSRALMLLERADEESDPARRRALLTFVVAGGGFSGVETMAALNGMVREERHNYPTVGRDDIRMILAQPGDRLLPELSSGLAAYTLRELERRGVEVRLNTEISGATATSVDLKPGGDSSAERVEASTLIWAAGVTPNPVINSSGLRLGKHHGIAVDGCCRVPDHPGLWALGDCAEVPEPGGRRTYAPTAQNAMREGAQVGRNIAAVLGGQHPQPFVYHPIGELALVGRRAGVASVYGLHLSGLLAWAMWRAIYLAKMPRTSKRVQIAAAWLVDLLFGRDIAALPSSRVRLQNQPAPQPAEHR